MALLYYAVVLLVNQSLWCHVSTSVKGSVRDAYFLDSLMDLKKVNPYSSLLYDVMPVLQDIHQQLVAKSFTFTVKWKRNTYIYPTILIIFSISSAFDSILCIYKFDNIFSMQQFWWYYQYHSFEIFSVSSDFDNIPCMQQF